MPKNKILTISLAAAITLSMVGCTAVNDSSLERRNLNPNGVDPYSVTRNNNNTATNEWTSYPSNRNLTRNFNTQWDDSKEYYGVGTRNNGNNSNYLNTSTSQMANACKNVKGVKDATVTIVNGKVYVGLDLENNVQSSDANSVKQQVNNALRKFTTDNTINITSDADIYGKLRDIGDGVRNGNPIDSYRNDFQKFDKSIEIMNTK